MTVDADISEPTALAERCAPDPRIARAERWLFMLRCLSDIGMWLVDALVRHAAPGASNPKSYGPRIAFPFGFDPAEAYERFSRAVRLALTLEAKIAREIAALRAGGSIAAAAPAASPARARNLPEAGREPAALHDQNLETLPEVDDEDAKDGDAAERAEALAGDLKEPVRESESFYRLLKGPLKDAVAAICADLGLRPDWSQWTEDGLPPPPDGDVMNWGVFLDPESDIPPAPGSGGREPKTPPPGGRPGGRDRAWRIAWPPPQRDDPPPD